MCGSVPGLFVLLQMADVAPALLVRTCSGSPCRSPRESVGGSDCQRAEKRFMKGAEELVAVLRSHPPSGNR